ncbi:MAG: acyltransferase domain-containing protein, partial [Leptolyngbya sp. SIO3F4]|nr:acyltransferase domain-containing protein [Leptolyngbya sp. SIO3F4]
MTHASDPIAIIGTACRVPGACNLDDFWHLLSTGQDQISILSPQRWSLARPHLSAQDLESIRKQSPVCWGGFLSQVDQFDPSFFGISAREAVSMSPQHRVLLEVAWETLEDAALRPDQLNKTNTGVFLGLTNRDYSHLTWNHHDLKDPYLTTGNSSSIAANRISYLLNLSGPCVVVDTACSSSLVAIHLACQSIRAGESTMAFAGGVNLTLDPDLMFNLAAGGFQAPDGRCKTFDSRADGYVRGEGAGLVLLKPLAQALTDGDPIHALILGSAVNQDGRTQGITAPKPTAQEAVVRQAYQQAGVSPGQVQYVETHGTGTKLGDPIELGALGKVLKDGRNPDDVCLVGAVKTNIGHLEAASGIAGLIKVVLSLQHRQIPPNLHFQSPNSYIPFGKLPVEVPQALTAWPSYGDDAIAGVSAFSFGGTNAHVVLQAAPHREKPVIQIERPLHLLTLSAKSTTALKDFAQRYEKHLQYHTEQTLGDICYTANIGRAHHDCRLAIVSTSKTDLMAKLKAFELGEDSSSFLEEQRSPNTQSNIAFLFTGQGSQYVDMGRELYETQLTFGRALDQCADILHEVNVPLLEVLYDQAEGDEQKINNTAYTQPALFALEYALYKLWQSWGINPSVVMGHSVGEYVAACVAGVFSLEDGLKLIAARGRLMQQLPSGGGMVSLMASVEKVKTVIADQPDVTIAAINGPQSTVISGPIPALQTMVEQFARAGVKGKFLSVSNAFHSPLMAPMLAEFEQVAKQVSYSPPKLKLISNVTGQVVTEAVATPDYWCEHILAPVNFAAGMERLQQEEINIFLECGPQPVLLGMGRQCLSEDEEIAWLPSLRPGQNDWQQILSSLGKLYICGVNIDWIGFDQDYPKRRKVTLPTYPFQRQHYWIEAVKQSMIGQRADKLIHPLLGQQLFLPTSQEIHFEANLNKNSPAYLGDHLVFDQLVFLGAGYLEMALAASLQIFQSQTLVLEDVSFVKALVLPSNGEDVLLHLVMKLESDQMQGTIATWQIFSLNNQSGTKEPDWILHARGKAIPQQADVATAPTCDLIALKSRFPEEFNQNVYDQALGLSYGPLLRHIKQIWLTQGEALGHIQLQDMLALETEQYVLHPALLDSCFQTMFTLVGNHDESFHISENPYLPVGLSRLTLHRIPTTEIWSQGLLNTTDLANSQQSSTDINLYTPQGEAVVTIEGLKARKTSIQELFSHQPQEPQPVYQVEWRSQARFGRLASPAFLLSSTELNTALALQVQTLLLENSTLHQQYADLFPFLESASLHFIVNALNTLGWTYPPGEQLHLEQVAQRLGIVPQHHRLLGRLLEILVEADILTHQQGQWQVLKSLPTAETIPPSSSLVTESAEWQLLERCGSQLAAVLRGAIDPVQLVFPGGDLSHATRLYQDSPTAQSFNRLVQQVVTTAVANCPANRGLRILEIGAGTGGTTSALLPHLSAEKTCYCFTDIGAMFTQKAQEWFGEAYPFVTYQTLDIEQNPSDQGFEMQQQDIVIAANVLHATRDLKQTLSHVRQLLAPGGLLVLLEGTARQRWVDLIFGLLDGWWRFSDRDLRPDYPLLNRAQWQQTLTETGFESVTVLPSEGVGDDLGQAVIVAQTDLTAAVEPELEPAKGWLLLADQQGVAQKIAQQLEAKGERFIVVSQVPQDMAGYQHLVAQIQTPETELKGVIHCW